MDRMPYMSDPTLVPRVQKYLESNVDKTFVDINVMADDLQRSYREYARLKRNAFRAQVKKAYSIVLQSYGLEDQDNSSSEDEDDSEDSAPEASTFHNNSLNNQLVNLYNRPQVPKQIDENELIDISSDDSEAPAYNDKPSNGPSTSQKESQALPTYQNNTNSKKVDANKDRYQYFGRKRKAETVGLTPYQSTPKKKKSLATLQEPSVSFKDIGGMDKILEDVCKLLIHVRHPEVYRQIGISPPRGFLLHGPPGCGKTLLANAIAGEIGVPLLKVAAPELVAGVSGESEERIRELFERAIFSTPCILFIDEIDAITPNRQNAQKEMERRIVAQLLSCLDDLSQNECGDRVLVIGATNRPDAIDPALRRAGRFDREICLGIPDVQARVQILKVLTAKLKLSEDFDYDFLAKHTPGYVGADLMSLTREAAMAAVNRMLNKLKEQHKLAQIVAAEKALEEKQKQETAKEETNEVNKSDPEIIVDDDPKTEPPKESPIVVIDEEVKQNDTPSTSEAVNGHLLAEEKTPPEEPMPVDVEKQNNPLKDLMMWLHDKSPLSSEELSSLCITMEDFNQALKCVQPSAKREGFATVPDVSWDDVGSLNSVREELQMAILAPIRHIEHFKELGLNTPTGVLLCGPPGCGKTLLAKAMANEAGINFISVKGPELLNMYVGESERAVRVCFERARNSAPCVIFFDELDAICPKRSDSREGGATMRVVNQMLTEMDGVQDRQGVYLLAASNRPDIVDPAVLRPGRFDKILFVGLPTASDRIEILRAITRNGTRPRLAPDVDLEAIASSEQCRGYTGADLAALVKEAGIVALKEFMLCGDTQKSLVVNMEHFTRAIAKIRPSVPEKDQKHYEKLRKMYAAVPENEVEEMEYS
ncbi:Nuclear valosin-containing protein-like [Tribolium castaneum]|uniref:Nuclear valosin-containing protein-like n=2 Tax=Tribolium castaneum TaxID=7070 RepID=D6WIP4_TRICA|nr:Nuclear valosin-containing protein-like [Tribolium castaneum]